MSNIPKLRFQEFSGEWEEKKLGNLLEFKNGINASKEQYGRGIKFINVLDILNNDYIVYENIIGKVDIDQEVLKKYSVGYGDVLFQRSSETREEVGTANVYLDEEKVATFGGFVIRGKKIGKYNPIFMNKILKTTMSRKEITSKSGGSTRYNVGQEILKDIELLFPTIKEQKKIALFFSLIDKKIKKQQEKVEALKEYKKGIMQKIFSQEIRFKGFSGEWQSKKLVDIATIIDGDRGINYPKESEFYDQEYCLFLNAKNVTKNGFDFSKNKFITKEKDNLMKKGKVELEDIVLTTRGTVGNIAYFDKLISYKNMRINSGMVLLRSKTIFAKYLYSYLKSNYFEKQVNQISFGSAQPQLTVKGINNFKIVITEQKEQQKIAAFLSLLDKKLKKEQQKLNLLNQYKKGLLQQMFV